MITMDASQYQADLTPTGVLALVIAAYILWKVLK